MTKFLLVLACVAGGLLVPVDAGAGSGLAGDKETRGSSVDRPGSIRYPVTIPEAADGSPAVKCDSEADCVLKASAYRECGWLEAMGAHDDAAAMCDLKTAVWQYCNALWPGRDAATFAERNTCDSRLSHAAGFYKWYEKHDHR